MIVSSLSENWVYSHFRLVNMSRNLEVSCCIASPASLFHPSHVWIWYFEFWWPIYFCFFLFLCVYALISVFVRFKRMFFGRRE